MMKAVATIGTLAVVLLIAVVGLVTVAQGDQRRTMPAMPMTASLADLVGPWHATPLRLDPVTWAKADQACRSIQPFPVMSTWCWSMPVAAGVCRPSMSMATP